MKFFPIFLCMLSTIFSHEDDLDTYCSTYLETKFLEKIDPSEIHLIFELGSLHALDAIKLERYYKASVYTFECNPQNILRAKKNIEKYNSSVFLVEKAVFDRSGEIPFFPCRSHPSTSSVYRFDHLSMEKNKEGTLRALRNTWKQEETTVEAIRLDHFIEDNGLEGVDLLCIDIQGATLPAIKSLGDYLEQVKYIICEIEYSPLYQGESLFSELNMFMESKGFTCYFQEPNSFWNDVLYVRK